MNGEISNGTAFTLRDVWLFHDRWAYRIPGSFAPGETLSVSDLKAPRHLDTILAGRKLWREEKKDTRETVVPWDRDSRDVRETLRILLFPRAAGGEAYTGLLNEHFSTLDLSSHLMTGSAVVFGEIDQLPMAWKIDGVDSDVELSAPSIFVRMLIPTDSATRGNTVRD